MPIVKECNVEDLARTIHKMSAEEVDGIYKLLEKVENETQTRHRAHNALDRAIRDIGDRAVDSDS